MSEETPPDDDRVVLKMLSDGGNDMSREMVIDYEVIVDSEENADQIADEAENSGFQSHVFFENGSTSEEEAVAATWKCVCSKPMIPEHSGIQDAKATVVRIARKFNGQFESWGTFGNAKES